MLSLQFIAENAHFAISLFAGLVFFAVFWLYFDAWVGLGHRINRTMFKWGGFLLLAISFIVFATVIEQTSLGQSVFGSISTIVSSIVRMLGYLCIIIGEVVDPLQPKPVNKGLEQETKPQTPAPAATPVTQPQVIQPAPAVSGSPVASSAQPIRVTVQSPAAQPVSAVPPTNPPANLIASFGLTTGFGAAYALPFGSLAVALLYLRRATIGIERHLRPVAIAFSFVFLFELMNLSALWRDTTNPAVYNLVQAFGPLWMVAHAALLIGAILLGRWVWRYLTERFMSQIFMTFVSIVLAIFLLTTVSFTFLLLRNIQDDGLNNLATATNVLQYALDSKKASTQANAEAVAANPAITTAIKAKDHKSLTSLTNTFLESKGEASLVVTSADGQVLLRAEDPDRWGDSLSSDTLVRRAVIGTTSSTVESKSGVLAPIISIRSVSPARDSSGTIVGTVSVATIIDNAFVDGIKHSTGLDSAIYSGNVRAATTFTGPDGISRYIGIKETDQTVQDTVLKHGEQYKGQLTILNRDYLAVYAPLKDADNSTIGMLFIGQPEVTILRTTSYLISLTFIVSVMLLVVAVIPAYIIARQITKQLL